MAKEYRRGLATRAINWWFQRLTKLGLGAAYRHILTVPGRRTPSSSDAAVAAELPRHPVFRLIPIQ
jgi:hypothetical protein